MKHIRTRAKRPAPTHRPTASPLDGAAAFEVEWNRVNRLFNAATPIVNRSFVYVIGEEDDGPVKIGVSVDPVKRRRQIQGCNPRLVCVEHAILGDGVVETLLHQLWREFALWNPDDGEPRGWLVKRPGLEWFRADIRPHLYPVLDVIAAKQVEYVEGRTTEVRMTELERIARKAHMQEPRPHVGPAEWNWIPQWRYLPDRVDGEAERQMVAENMAKFTRTLAEERSAQ